MPKTKSNPKNQPTSKKEKTIKSGWWYGETETLMEAVGLFNDIESEKYIVRDVDIEEDRVNGTWRFIYKVIDKE